MSTFPWNKKNWQHVTAMSQRNELPHAFLFSGLMGLGKLEFARSLALFLMCENNGASSGGEAASCGHCKQCKLFLANTHPDFKLLSPEEGSKVIKVDTIRLLVDFFGQSSMQGGKKIAILSPAESLNHNAANALLKTLEEPTPNSHIILISHSPGRLLATIRSRCQVVDFSRPSEEVTLNWLSDNVDKEEVEPIDKDDLLKVLALAQYAPLRAKEYIDSNALKESNTMIEELSSVLKKERVVSSVSERWNDDIASLRLSWMLQWLANILKIQLAGNSTTTSDKPESKMWVYLAEHCSAKQLFDLYQLTLDEYKLFQGVSNPNKVLSFDFLLNHWLSFMHKSNQQN